LWIISELKLNVINNFIVAVVKMMPKNLVHVFAKKYIAGERLDDGVNTVRELNALGICATMDVLGESVNSKDEAMSAKSECMRVLDAIDANKLDSNLSVKPTQLGLLIDEDFCYKQMKELVEAAAGYNNMIRIDMEDSTVTDKIINLFLRLKADYDNVGIVLQSYMKRTISDVKKLMMDGTNFRICKGIYIEPEEVAYKDRELVRQKYLDALELLFNNRNYVGIATHDDPLVEGAYKMIEEKGIEKKNYEFQMLYGVKEGLRDRINADGHKIRIYVPYGDHWYAYSIRRLQENPRVAWYITKSLFTFN
jgi:proline dehydrogenase